MVVVEAVVFAAVADGDHSGHGHDHDHGHDLLRLSRYTGWWVPLTPGSLSGNIRALRGSLHPGDRIRCDQTIQNI